MRLNFDKFQQLGRALMLPIALLPIAGLLLRFGQPDLLNIKFIADAGNTIFANLPLLFALGISVGLAKDNNGTSALASCIGYLVMTVILTDIDKTINVGVLGGIIIGIIAAILYNRFHEIKLPEYLAFFGGKRFVPIITGLCAVFIGILLGYIWSFIQNGINIFGDWLLASGTVGVFIYGVVNRLLLITGLHHILNNLVWFIFGNYTNSLGEVVHGDIARFMAGDKTAGRFMAGYFPIMMFGLPACCLAMYKNAYSENKKIIAGMLFSMALTSFITGVTEPIEFAFVFLAPLLFVIHAILTGISLAVMYLLNVHMGFTFSAGLIDYILFFKLSTHPLYLLPVGIVFFIIYYLLFDFVIRYFDLATIGRDKKEHNKNVSINLKQSKAELFIAALGGRDNIISVDACTTRLRLKVINTDNINRKDLQILGSKAVIAPTQNTLQVILGPIADIVATEMNQVLKLNVQNNSNINNSQQPINLSTQSTQNPDFVLQATQIIIQGLGGIDNIEEINIYAITRLRCKIFDNSKIDQKIFNNLHKMYFINISNNIKHIQISTNIDLIYKKIQESLK